MRTDPGIMTDYKVNGSSNLSIWFSFDISPPPLVEDPDRFYRSGEK